MANNFVVASNAEQGDEETQTLPSENISDALDSFRFRDYRFEVTTKDSKRVAATTEFELPTDLKTNSQPDSFGSYSINGELYRVYQRSFQVGGETFYLFAVHSLTDRLALESRLRNSVFAAVPVALLLAGLGGYILARRSFRPIRDMSVRASLITSQNLHERLPVVNEKDELGKLATVFNEVLDRLDKSFEQQRRFMADASHELRTPLAIVRGESEVALSKSTRLATEYQESLAIVHDESKRLTRIVDDLFTLARADAGNFTIYFSEVYFDEIAAECVRSVRTLAEKKKIQIVFSAEETPFRGDESLLRRLLLNLLDNAVKYNNHEGSITVEIKDRLVSIANTGPEIPIYQKDKIFERFFRADAARTRGGESSTSGAGLGLSISKWIAELHGTKLELTKSEHGKNTFCILLPR
ncbi:MAG: ATP-binding protein [Acidobacteriota bacterium]